MLLPLVYLHCFDSCGWINRRWLVCMTCIFSRWRWFLFVVGLHDRLEFFDEAKVTLPHNNVGI